MVKLFQKIDLDLQISEIIYQRNSCQAFWTSIHQRNLEVKVQKLKIFFESIIFKIFLYFFHIKNA